MYFLLSIWALVVGLCGIFWWDLPYLFNYLALVIFACGMLISITDFLRRWPHV